MKKYKKYIKNVTISTFFLSVLLLLPNNVLAQTSEPKIQTNQTPFGQSIVVTFPQNYSGQVVSTFDGTSWKTETKKYTQADIDSMNKKIQEQQKALQKYLQDRQKFWQQFWSTDFPTFPIFPSLPFWF